ncbi:cell division ATP-binding protein FtsE [Parvimonas micra]|uniref:Cell division ATP-binding protein FtsE n=2 Tax=Parvimonas micra TaxID=33033 RepID=A0A3B7DU35_9FIRM|nr:cell division ATP-binding protein FtsE [Parvimonas micra]MBF1300542.1 cell division ATP-binding protein FtsE [Parvimonas sp.]AXU10669.1 cell division ATP-binding protein FtsE [Parvimonas micra]EDP23347.1 cell division ATP-binding protein FtsE [Parvimonas micra ATCC 33270]MBF1306729.1 cell division ATP-binding protein FtsE [Parvimonas micra]MCK6130610.1 cell division ATP-binding protein FtsE [Parvimonas micra]
MLEFIEVNKIYNNDVCALKDLSFKVEDGEFVFLIGASGAGKTSIIKMLLREIKPTSGEIIVDNVNIVKLRNRKIPQLRKTMGVVFQDFRLLEGKTVFDNIKYPLQILGVSKRVITKRVTEILELVGLSDRANSFPNQLSGGEQQRVCIARALVNKPKYLIADEPTGNLDPNTSEGIMKLLLDVNAKGTTVIVSTHDRDIVNKLKKRVISMDHGEMINDEERGGYFNEFN